MSETPSSAEQGSPIKPKSPIDPRAIVMAYKFGGRAMAAATPKTQPPSAEIEPPTQPEQE